MQIRPFKRYLADVSDPDGVIYRYVFTATSRRRARREAREWVSRTEWGATLVRITRAAEPGLRAKGLRLLALASLTLVVSGATIAVMMIAALSLQGAL